MPGGGAMSGHTPGPWYSTDACQYFVIAPDGAPVCAIIPRLYRGVANRNLIAAAPELLAMLKEITGDGVIDDVVMRDRALATIAKAEGVLP